MDKNMIGQRIRESRKRLGITQEQLANDVFISESYMTLIELGKRNVSIDILSKLSKRLGVTADYLLTGNIGSMEEMLFLEWYNIVKDRTEFEIRSAHDTLRNFFSCLDKVRDSK